MPNEKLINEIESILGQVAELGAEKERTRLGPNLLVTNPTPTGLSNYILVRDDRDGDNILALKVPGVVYNTNDLVNVLFVRGGEAIAFQQGSGSSSSGIWGIIAGTSTDIYYNAGDAVIGKVTAPDARLELLDTAQPQLRLTFQDATKYADLTVDTSHDLTINPSSTGQIILATVDVTIEEDLIHSGDTDTKMTFTADDIEFTVGGLSLLKLTEDAQDLITLGPGSGDVDINFNGDMFLRGSDAFFGHTITAPSSSINQIEMASSGNKAISSSSFSTTATFAGEPVIQLQKSHTASIGTLSTTQDGERLGRLDIVGVDSNNANRSTAGFRATQVGAAGVANVPSKLELVAANNVAIMALDESQNVGVGITSAIAAKLHVDQSSTTAAIPVLYLDQADVSEEMVEFNTTIGVGNAIEAVGAKTLTPTHFIKCTLPGGLTRYWEVGTIA